MSTIQLARLSRRRFLTLTSLMVGVIGAAGVTYASHRTSEQASRLPSAVSNQSPGPYNIRVAASRAALATIATDLDDFIRRHADASTTITTEEDDARLHGRLVSEFAAGTPADIVFLAPDEVWSFSRKSLLRDLTTLVGASDLALGEYPFVTDQTTLRGNRYSVASSVHVRCFMFNQEYLGKTGATPPQTWDDVRVTASALQLDKVCNYAFFWPLKTGDGFFGPDYLGLERPMFDRQLNPTFLGDPSYRTILDWKMSALYTWKIVDPRGPVMDDVDENFPYGWTAFTWAPLELLYGWQHAGHYGARGKLRNALVPAPIPPNHGTLGSADLWGISATSNYPEQAWLLLSYLAGGRDNGGRDAMTRRWRDAGSGFTDRRIENDPQVRATAREWCDFDAYIQQIASAQPSPGTSTPWYRDWLAFAGLQSTLLVHQKIDSGEFIKRLGIRWQSLKTAFGAHQPSPDVST